MVDTTSKNLQNETIQTIITIGEEKSIFERAIIEAFKQKHSKAIYEKLMIALDEIKFMVNDIKTNQNAKIRVLLNKNTLDKLSRIIERKYFNVNILIAKIYENLLDPSNFPILSEDINMLIKFSNEVLNLLESIDSTIVSKSLEKKCSSFLNYLINLEGLDSEQITTISEIINNFPTRNCSPVYKSFDSISEKIIKLCRNPSVDDKTEGINSLMENFGNTASLEEQFDLLLEKVTPIIKAVIHQPNPEYKDVYFQLGNFICSMLYATKFKVDAYMPEYRINFRELNKNGFYMLLGDELIDETLKENASFLHNVVYELTSQKEIITKCENIYNICNLIINTTSIYENVFDLQFVCYIILKRIYFTFPQFRKNIEDTLAINLINLCSFKDQFEKDNSEECRQFVYYLLQHGEEDLQRKLKKKIETKNVQFEFNSYSNEDIADVEHEILKLSDFNLRIGYPNKYEIDAGCEISKYIEVHHTNSLVYIGFATQYNDITLHLLKYIPNDDNKSNESPQVKIEGEEISDLSDDENTSPSDEDFTDKGHFRQILKLERIDASLSPVKIVMFITEPGTYKLVFDNSFSWFNSKLLRFRLSVLKPISEIDLNRKVDFDSLRRKMNSEIKKVFPGNKQEVELANLSGSENISLLHTKSPKASPHANKILMAKIEGINRAFKIDQIFHKQELLRKNPDYISIPVILTSNLIRIFRTYSNEYGVEVPEFIEYQVDSNYEKTFTEVISNYVKEINNYKNKYLFLNIFLIEKKLSITNEVDANIAITNATDKFYKNVLNKLTFWPQELIDTFPNLKFFLNSFSDGCLLYNLYEKLVHDRKFNNIIHIHFDKIKSQVSLFFEGIFHDKISGFNYDTNKSLFENVENVIEFLNKVSVIFGEFELSVSSSDIDEK